jgi:hypothetical protein
MRVCTDGGSFANALLAARHNMPAKNLEPVARILDSPILDVVTRMAFPRGHTCLDPENHI